MNLTPVQLVSVSPEYEDTRLDNFLMGITKGVPKSRIYRAIRQGEVRVNKKRAKPETRVHAGDEVRVPPLAQGEAQYHHIPDTLARELKAAILFENEQIIVLNKPAGLAVHGGSGVSLGLIEAMRLMYPECKHLELVHRLDKNTSGCLILAKKRTVLKTLQVLGSSAFAKTYHVVVSGAWPKSLQKVDLPLLKVPQEAGEHKVIVHREGKPSQTLFKILAQNQELTLLEARLLSGRMHQIRVHCAHHGHPVLGDLKYGRDKLSDGKLGYMALHAYHIAITCPELNLELELTAPYSQRFRAYLEAQGLLEG